MAKKDKANSDDEKVKEKMPINAILILEVLGKPKAHLTKTLENLIKKIGEEKGVTVIEKKINEPVTMKDNEKFFTSFAEIEVRVEDIRNLVGLSFKYMPAHLDIIEPENLNLTNNLFAEMLNELIRRLHGYDEIAKVIQVEKKILEKKLRTLLEKQKDEDKEKSEKEKNNS